MQSACIEPTATIYALCVYQKIRLLEETNHRIFYLRFIPKNFHQATVDEIAVILLNLLSFCLGIERLFRNGFVRNRKHIHPSRSLHWAYELSILRNGSQTAQHRFVTDTCDRRRRERHELGAIYLCLHSLSISGQRIEILRFQVTDNLLGFLIVTNLHSQYIFHLFQRSISFFCNVVKSSDYERVIEGKDFRNLAFVGIKRPTNGLTGIIDSG